MKVHIKSIIFVLVVLAVGAIFVIPYLTPGKPLIREFAVTPRPVEALQKAAANGRPVLLDFYSKGWAACRDMEPVVLALHNKYGDRMDFVTADVNTPEGGQLAQQYQITLIPAFFLLDKEGAIGQSVPFEQIAGNPGAGLEKAVADFLAQQ